MTALPATLALVTRPWEILREAWLARRVPANEEIFRFLKQRPTGRLRQRHSRRRKPIPRSLSGAWAANRDPGLAP